MGILKIFALTILKTLPVEQVVAWLLTAALSRAGAPIVRSFSKTATHLGELASLLGRAAEDGKIGDDEVALLKAWSFGDSAKDIEAKIEAKKEIR